MSGAGRKLGERERSGERRSIRKRLSVSGASAERGVAERNGAESGLNRALKDRSEVDPTVALYYKSAPVIISSNFD